MVSWILKYKKILSSRVRQNSVKILQKIGLDVSLLEEAPQAPQWPRQNPVKEIQDNDLEVKREMKVHTISKKEGILERLESLISDWMRMK